MANVKIQVHEQNVALFLQRNKPMRDQLIGVGNDVAAVAQATADSAQRGAGGRISNYAEAGFSVVWEGRGGQRPRVNVVSDADPMTALAAHFYTQKRDGVAHLRAALYSQTSKG